MGRNADFDVARARADTPGVLRVIHLNNAGAGLAPRQVISAMVDHVELEGHIGPYEAAERSQAGIDRAYQALAELVNCDASEIAVLDSATRAWGAAVSSIQLGSGDRVLVSRMEYGSNYISLLHLARRTGTSVEVVPSDASGAVSAPALRRMLDERVKLIAITHVPMHDGLVNPVAAIGEIAREHGALYLVDACQSVGQLPVDVRSIGCDLLVGSGRKYLRGPRGTGFLFGRHDVAERLSPLVLGLDGAEWIGGDYRLAPGVRRFETWEANCASRVGLAVAVDYALAWDVRTTWRRIESLAARLRTELARIPGVRVEDRGDVRCGIVALTVEGHEPVALREELRDLCINTWVCLPNAACLDMQARDVTSVLRLSVHYYNTDEELDRLCSVLESLVVRRRVHAV
jgi:selenocysteine lyase/cysteine desulfurase